MQISYIIKMKNCCWEKTFNWAPKCFIIFQHSYSSTPVWRSSTRQLSHGSEEVGCSDVEGRAQIRVTNHDEVRQHCRWAIGRQRSRANWRD